MKHLIKLQFSILLLTSCFALHGQSQNKEIQAEKVPNTFSNERLSNTEVWRIKSDKMKRSLDIFVGLPFGYHKSHEQYPVMLALDADVTFGMANDIPKLMAFENTVPSMIVVGVSFRTFTSWINSRTAYLTPTKDLSISSASGQAQTFLSFINSELLPFIGNQYRIKANDKTLYGHSYAGLFTLYIMFNSPSSFNKYVSTSPSVDWHQEVIVKSLAGIETKKSPATKLYLSIGEKEHQLMPAYNKFMKTLQSKDIPKLRIKSETTGNARHMESMASSYTNGLLWVFDQ